MAQRTVGVKAEQDGNAWGISKARVCGFKGISRENPFLIALSSKLSLANGFCYPGCKFVFGK